MPELINFLEFFTDGVTERSLFPDSRKKLNDFMGSVMKKSNLPMLYAILYILYIAQTKITTSWEILAWGMGKSGQNIYPTLKSPSLTLTLSFTPAENIVKQRCNGKKRCSVAAKSYLFGDPCKGVNKYLQVTYTCITAGKVILLEIGWNWMKLLFMKQNRWILWK